MQSFSYRYGVLAVNFLISAIIFWKNTQCCTGGQFCHGKIPSHLHSGATNTKLCTGFPVIFLHSSMASTFMITSRTNAAFDCGSFLLVLPFSAVYNTHSGLKSISMGPLNDILFAWLPKCSVGNMSCLQTTLNVAFDRGSFFICPTFLCSLQDPQWSKK